MTMNFMPTLNKIHGDRSRIKINSLEYTYFALLSFNKKIFNTLNVNANFINTINML